MASALGSREMTARKAELKRLNDRLAVGCVKAKGSNDIIISEFKMAVPIMVGYMIDESSSALFSLGASQTLLSS